MKKSLVVLILSMLLLCSFLIGCGGPTVEDGGNEEQEWTPTGEEVTLIEKDQTSSFYFIYSDSDTSAKDAAVSFRAALSGLGLKGAGQTAFPSNKTFDPANEHEILFGDTGREASKIAIKFLEEKVAGDPDGFHWVFYYRDGSLAIVANSAVAYSFALEDMKEVLISDGNLAFKDTLKYSGILTAEEYEAILLERDKVESDRRKEENKKLLSALLEKVEDQRAEFRTIKGTWSKYAAISASNPEILLFGDYTENIGTSEWGTAETTPSAEHPRLLITADSLPLIRAYLLGDNANAKKFENTLRDALLSNEGILSEPEYKGENATVSNSNIHNWDAYYLDVIQAKALAYLLYEDDYYGYQAIYYLKNFLKSLDIVKIASDQCRQYGYVMYTAAIVYDWCYPLLTDVDKTQLIAGVENCICRGENQIGVKMEVGFPPAGQDSVAGHGSEYQVMRDYLSFAIAIYGDNDSWWNFVAPRIYNDYVAFRNYYFQSNMTPQGTGTYIQARHIADLYSAWMLQVATGSNPYVGMENTIRSTLGYEVTPGYLFNDGDGTGDSVAANKMVSMAYITAFLYADAPMLAQADFLSGNTAFASNYSGISSVSYLALRGMCRLKPAEDRYENMELLQYNGFPLGQYVAHSAWGTADAASVLMRIKERSTSGHEHSDSGTFEIYYKGMLTSDGGAYNNFFADHTQYFHQATISHNGLLIYNSSLSGKDNGYYSGGQRNDNTPGNNLSAWLNNYGMETGKVTGREHGYNDDGSALYAYIAGDITKAYHYESVSYVGRRMLTVFTGDEDYPMAFFVYDDITSLNKLYEKKFLLQISSKDAPTIDGKTVITENGDGRLVLTCLTSHVTITGLGGRTYTSGAYDCANSKNYLVNGKQLLPMNGKADDGHWGRVEIFWKSQTADATFMNVIYVTDKGNKKEVDVTPLSQKNGVDGGIYDGRIAAIFATDRTGAKDTISCTVVGDKSVSYYVSGVAAGEWKVSVGGKDCGTYTATEEGGLLTFTAPSGEITISPVK